MSKADDDRLIAEYRKLQQDTIKTLQQEVRRISDEFLVFKTKWAFVMMGIGGATGIVTSVAMQLVINYLTK